ncbi:MAG: pre-peptidase C-terminal domain-containing protein [Cyanobacteria bacterium P01_H01_bin.26]
MANYNLGELWNPFSINNYSVTLSHPTDRFQFDVTDLHNITLDLHDISAGDNANLYLYRDSNGNNIFDASDVLVNWSAQNGDTDEMINATAIPSTYFAIVSRGAGSDNSVSYDLDISVNHDAGSLGITPVAFDNSELTVNYPTSVFEFDISSSRYVHITLAHLNAGTDGNLKLYLDNGNSIFDNGDTLVSSPTFGKGNDESIDYKAQAGTYFVEVSRNKYTNNNDPLLYNLKMSATLINNRVSNLVVGEVVMGDITSNTPIKAGYLGIGDEDTTDTYAFSLETYEGVNISLSGLDSDANLRLIRDTNNNGIVDSGEVVDGSYTFGASDEQINNITLSGAYFLQVFQGLYGWPTSYTVEFDHFTTTYA